MTAFYKVSSFRVRNEGVSWAVAPFAGVKTAPVFDLHKID
jgi:hypothetical protein